MSVDFFSKGLKCLNQATIQDHFGNLEDALQIYTVAFEYFIAGLKCI